VSAEFSEFVDARVGPRGSLENLSQTEIEKLLDTGQGGLYPLFRRCALAVLNSGAPTDNSKEIFDRYRDFEIRIVRHPWGVKLEVQNAPASAFVDGQMIRGIKEHLFAVLRDVVFISNEIIASGRFDLEDSASITNAVFHVLRNARLLDYKARPNLVVCWGGHSIPADEYQYTKNVGYELGLRGLDVCTGCGPGAMKGPMKGATIGHAKQRIEHSRYIGITEPGIIAAEPPNPIFTQLAIMTDIEKRREAIERKDRNITQMNKSHD
jgi:pyrimidine/purine-5'-nucleotide nucleosidase